MNTSTTGKYFIGQINKFNFKQGCDKYHCHIY